MLSKKIPVELHDEILGRVAKNLSAPTICAWLKKQHKIAVTPQALNKLIRKHRSARADVAKVVARTHIEKTLPSDLAEYDKVQATNYRLLRKAQRRASLPDCSLADIEAVVKLTGVYLKADEQKKKALGLEQPDEVVADLATLLAKA